MSLRNIIEWNNEAVSLLACQQFRAAIRLTTSAMQQLQVLTGSAQQRSTHTHTAIDGCMMMSDRIPSVGASDDTFVYQNGILLPSNITDISVILPILLFNAALAQQLFSASSSDGQSMSQPALPRARRLYQLALSDHCDCCNPAFRVAATNNLGVLCRQIGGDDHEEGEALFDYLEAFALYILTTGRAHQIRKVNGFWANIRPGSRRAAAA